MDSSSKMSSESTEQLKVEGVGERDSPSPEQLRRDLEEEFNVQRAKMKELFLQKEVDLRKLRHDNEQLESETAGLRAQLQQLQVLSQNQRSEIESLQMLVSETVEVSSSDTEEARRLRARNLDLETQLGHMRHQQQQQEVSLAPATLVRNLARKLTADTPEETPRKVEDNELLRSIIEPLEHEIFALKNKLRDTDTQLQETLKAKAIAAAAAPPATVASGDTNNESVSESASARDRRCDMCLNYEKQLVAEQAAADAARDRAYRLDLALKKATEELEGVRSLHDETVRSWHGERASQAALVNELRDAVRDAAHAVEARLKEAARADQGALQLVTELTVDRETLQRKLDTLERDNAVLIGHYLKKAEEMQNEIIDLPDNVEELQELTLRLRQQLIFCQIGREEADDGERELRTQLLEQGALFHQQDAELSATRKEIRETREELDRMRTEHEQMKELGDKLRHSNDMIEKLLDDKKRLQSEVMEIRQRVSVLQQELDNSEKVQQDFVRLSQSLQVQLQRIREADTEVRWQNDDDVTQCPSCHTALPTVKKKVHCRHCGRIFCASCVSHSVASGPRGTPARVCAVCRTLLQPHTAPYFSTAPPHTPD